MELRENLPIILISIGIITMFLIFIGVILYLNFSDETHHFVIKYAVPIILVIIMLGLFITLAYAIITRIRHTRDPMIFDSIGRLSGHMIQDDDVVVHTPEYNGRHPALLQTEDADVSRRASVSSPAVEVRSSSESVPVIERRQSVVTLPFPRRSVDGDSSNIRYVTPPSTPPRVSEVSGTPSSIARIPFPQNRNTNITPPMTPETAKNGAQRVRIVTEIDQYGRIIRRNVVPLRSYENFSHELPPQDSPPREPRVATSGIVTLEDVESDSSAEISRPYLDTSSEDSD